MPLTNEEWAKKFNAECQTKEHDAVQWCPHDFDYNPEYDEEFHDYCCVIGRSYTLCDACTQNRNDFMNIREGTTVVKRRIDHIEAFLREKFPDFRL